MTDKERIEELEALLGEAYVVMGSLLVSTRQFGSVQADKILDNLAEMRMVHTDVLPWPERHLAVTRYAETGEGLAVTWQDTEGKILHIVWSKHGYS